MRASAFCREPELSGTCELTLFLDTVMVDHGAGGVLVWGEVAESGLVALTLEEDLDELEEVGAGQVGLEQDAAGAADVGDLPFRVAENVSTAALSKQSPVEPNEAGARRGRRP